MTDEPHEHYLRGVGREESDPQSARDAYEACLKGDCTHLEARINLGRLLHLAGRHAEAEALYRDTEEADGTLYFNLATVLEEQGRMEEAIHYYRQAVLHGPELLDAHYNLAELLDETGDSVAASRHRWAYQRLVQAQQSPATFEDFHEPDDK